MRLMVNISERQLKKRSRNTGSRFSTNRKKQMPIQLGGKGGVPHQRHGGIGEPGNALTNAMRNNMGAIHHETGRRIANHITERQR